MVQVPAVPDEPLGMTQIAGERQGGPLAGSLSQAAPSAAVATQTPVASLETDFRQRPPFAHSA